jgi:hypothetical protein
MRRAQRATLLYSVAILAALAVSPMRAQVSSSPAPPPYATAENEGWYLSGAPISLNGTVYFPSGPIVHFNRNEMLPTGIFEHVPIYSRLTQEPKSVVYVPLAGGLVRPYERRRAGDLAGTTGSSAPAFPVVLPAEQALNPAIAFEQAAHRIEVPREVSTAGFMYGVRAPAAEPALGRGEPPAAVGTAGAEAALPAAAPVRGPLQTARRPIGLNGVFIEFEGRRWFAAGTTVEITEDKFARIGDYEGFPVYRQPGVPDVIYVPVTAAASGLLVPYSAR